MFKSDLEGMAARWSLPAFSSHLSSPVSPSMLASRLSSRHSSSSSVQASRPSIWLI